ncbi:unnamed protein product, partial [marine sediment metagenome]
MSRFSLQIQKEYGLEQSLVPENMFNYIQNFWILKLHDHEEANLDTNYSEVGVLILSGKCIIEARDFGYPIASSSVLPCVGSRKNVFEGLPTAIYMPTKEKFKIIAQGEVELAICAGACEEKTQPALIQPKDIKVISVGRGNWKREVRLIIGENSPSVNLIIGECLNPSGNWSGTPPHKHENDNLPYESLHEELYYFKTKTPNGFGIQRLYSPERNIDKLILLKNNTITFIPWGYHQIVAGPGYPLYYLFFLS